MKTDSTSRFDPRSGKPRKSLAQILTRYMVSQTGCWEWTGARNQHGYGIVGLMLDGKINTMPAHRLQWMHLKGRPADGYDICHHCDNRCCINPDHLFEGTPGDNIRDCVAKGRHDSQAGSRTFWERYRRNEVPYLGKYHRERFPHLYTPTP